MSGGLMSGGRMSGGRLSGGLKSYDRHDRLLQQHALKVCNGELKLFFQSFFCMF